MKSPSFLFKTSKNNRLCIKVIIQNNAIIFYKKIDLDSIDQHSIEKKMLFFINNWHKISFESAKVYIFASAVIKYVTINLLNPSLNKLQNECTCKKQLQ